MDSGNKPPCTTDTFEPEILARRFYRCFESGCLALARGDVAAYREIAAEGVSRLSGNNDYWLFAAVRSATLSPDSPVAPQKLVAMAERLDTKGGWGWWSPIMQGNALFRAGRDKEALAAIEGNTSTFNAKAVVALIHAHGGRSRSGKTLASCARA